MCLNHDDTLLAVGETTAPGREEPVQIYVYSAECGMLVPKIRILFEDYWRTKGNTIIFDSILGVRNNYLCIEGLTHSKEWSDYVQSILESEDLMLVSSFGIQIWTTNSGKEINLLYYWFCSESDILRSLTTQQIMVELLKLVNKLDFSESIPPPSFGQIMDFQNYDGNYNYHIYMKPTNTECAWKYGDTFNR
ncbi:hypothetical protein F8M41_011126 [Gigaspora margarita]|uniref:Uncharacterized protein n=1 Tax=Gigaspora margarita TaxID=4874 RepID=A0A8H4A1U2_GIGMA|nr:hypothetical protein F8M41_011126 [Gigaspora margarita]